jgi:hypothetical protein
VLAVIWGIGISNDEGSCCYKGRDEEVEDCGLHFEVLIVIKVVLAELF